MHRSVLVAFAIAACTACPASRAATPEQSYTAQHATFDRIDGNHAGRISYEEYRNYGVGVFHALDADHNDRIEAKEHSSATADVDIVAFNDALRQWFDGADTNKDGFVDWDEWSAAPVGPARAATGEAE